MIDLIRVCPSNTSESRERSDAQRRKTADDHQYRSIPTFYVVDLCSDLFVMIWTDKVLLSAGHTSNPAEGKADKGGMRGAYLCEMSSSHWKAKLGTSTSCTPSTSCVSFNPAGGKVHEAKVGGANLCEISSSHWKAKPGTLTGCTPSRVTAMAASIFMAGSSSGAPGSAGASSQMRPSRTRK